ncbi:MAG: dicarboxylate/amino acid:cation symporter, partial [Proteobacteria bacterium]|nr:dicarboxylate/amino acid:cation symporter [Pseudomonadota bacterium]
MKNRLTFYVVLAMIVGPLAGLLLHHWLGEGESAKSVASNLSLVTTAFLHLIKMIIAPLVFSTLVVGVARMEDTASIARVGLKTLGWFIFASIVSMTIGLVLVQWFKPGAGLPQPPVTAGEIPKAITPQLKDFIDHIIPSSVIQAMASNEILQIVVFSLLFGAGAAALGKRVSALIDWVDELSMIMLKITGYVMATAPVAVFAALAGTVLSQGVAVLGVYARFVGGFYVALVTLWGFLSLALWLNIGRRAGVLLKMIRSPVLIAFSTASSEAAYPRTLEQLENFGVNRRIASFVLPLGYSFNLDGSMMYCTFAVLFIAQIFQIEITLQQQVVMLMLLMVTSKGMAGVPRASLMVIASTLAYFGLPESGLVMIIAVDHLLDMGRSATNVVGNAVASTLVAKWEGELSQPEGAFAPGGKTAGT